MRKQSPHRLKHATIGAKRILKDLVIVYMSCDDVCVVVNRRTKRIVPVDKVMHELFTGFAYRWSVLIAAYGYDAGRDDYMQSELILAKQDYKQATLSDRLNEEHARLVEEFEGDELVGLGWIASANGDDPWGERGEHALDLFKTLGAYGAPAKGEKS